MLNLEKKPPYGMYGAYLRWALCQEADSHAHRATSPQNRGLSGGVFDRVSDVKRATRAQGHT
eukprot:scaffold41216_cov66-Phaeocystis_antarctica.AAC.1